MLQLPNGRISNVEIANLTSQKVRLERNPYSRHTHKSPLSQITRARQSHFSSSARRSPTPFVSEAFRAHCMCARLQLHTKPREA